MLQIFWDCGFTWDEDKNCADAELLSTAAGRPGVYGRTSEELMMSK